MCTPLVNYYSESYTTENDKVDKPGKSRYAAGYDQGCFQVFETAFNILTTPLVLQGESYVRSQSFRPLEGGRRRSIHPPIAQAEGFSR